MKSSKLATTIGLTVGSVLFVANSAEAASFTSNITVDKNNAEKGDIILNSITQNGETFNNFSYVNRANIIYNDHYTGGNTGAISTDHGDLVEMGEISRIEGLNDYSLDHEQNVVDFLGNNNLNKILDTEDAGAFTLDLFFDSLIQNDNSGLDSLFFFERGMNSNMFIQALDSDGNTIGNQLLLQGRDKRLSKQFRKNLTNDNVTIRDTQEKAGYRINTKEIGGAQDVGSWGVSLEDELGVDSLVGVQISAQLTDKENADIEAKVKKMEEKLEKRYANEDPEVREPKMSRELRIYEQNLRKKLLQKNFQGPDFTVIARTSSSESRFAQAAKVPEPGTIIGLGSVAALAFMRRRKSKYTFIKSFKKLKH